MFTIFFNSQGLVSLDILPKRLQLLRSITRKLCCIKCYKTGLKLQELQGVLGCCFIVAMNPRTKQLNDTSESCSSVTSSTLLTRFCSVRLLTLPKNKIWDLWKTFFYSFRQELYVHNSRVYLLLSMLNAFKSRK